MRNQSLILFLAISFTALSLPAYALVCEKTSFVREGFLSIQTAKLAFPESKVIADEKFKPIRKTSKSMLFEEYKPNWIGIHKVSYRLLLDGRLIVKLHSEGGYKDISPVSYQCDKTSSEIK